MENRQAIVLIHGVGEQLPMQTLRSFVKAVWVDDRSLHRAGQAGGERSDEPVMWSKPDHVSGSFELRRLTTSQNRNGVLSDFFEFYWAHLMKGTTAEHVWGWARTLLLRDPRTVPPQLRGIYALIVAGVVTSAGLMIYAAVAASAPVHETAAAGAVPSWLKAVGSLALSVLILPAINRVLRYVVGDAARYLHPAPGNVQRRHEIREAGIALLEKLHERGYGRIVVVGHSLGSVIGYDILTHAFAAWHDRLDVDASKRPTYARLDAIERLAIDADDGNTPDVGDLQRAQRAYLAEYQSLGGAWRVTDFVTLGSPLAHAELLLARDAADLERRKAERELPTYPPRLESVIRGGTRSRHFSFHRRFEVPTGPRARNPTRTVRRRVPHHAAVFALTRWTNLYFPNHHVFWGDLIAGPVAPMFGSGVRDIAVNTRRHDGLFSHTQYWRYDGDIAPGHVLALREALDLADDRGAGADENA